MPTSLYGSSKHHSTLFFLLFVVFAGFVGAVMLVLGRGGLTTDSRSQASNDQEYYFRIDPVTVAKSLPPVANNDRMPTDLVRSTNGGPTFPPAPSPTTFPHPSITPMPNASPNQYDLNFFGSNGKTQALVSRFNLTITLPEAFRQQPTPMPTPTVMPTPCPVPVQQYPAGYRPLDNPANGGTPVGPQVGRSPANPRVILPPQQSPCPPIIERQPGLDLLMNNPRYTLSNRLTATFVGQNQFIDQNRNLQRYGGQVLVSQEGHELFAIFQDPSSKLQMDGATADAINGTVTISGFVTNPTQLKTIPWDTYDSATGIVHHGTTQTIVKTRLPIEGEMKVGNVYVYPKNDPRLDGFVPMVGNSQVYGYLSGNNGVEVLLSTPQTMPVASPTALYPGQPCELNKSVCQQGYACQEQCTGNPALGIGGTCHTICAPQATPVASRIPTPPPTPTFITPTRTLDSCLPSGVAMTSPVQGGGTVATALQAIKATCSNITDSIIDSNGRGVYMYHQITCPGGAAPTANLAQTQAQQLASLQQKYDVIELACPTNHILF